MKLLSRILFPAAVMAFTTAGALDFGNVPAGPSAVPSVSESRDTVVYPPYNYRPRSARGNAVADSLYEDIFEIPDSSLSERSLSPRDSLKALLDSTLWDKLDSIYIADSTAKAKAKFDAWYASLSKEEKKKYDKEQLTKLKVAKADSLRAVKEEKKAIRDSILEATPRILETYAIPDSMQYKRIIAWTLDRDFGKLKRRHGADHWDKTIRFFDDHLESVSGGGAPSVLPYRRIRREYETEHMYVLDFGSAAPAMAFAKDGFTLGSFEEMKDWLLERQRASYDQPQDFDED